MWRRFLTVFLWVCIVLGTLGILGAASENRIDATGVVFCEFVLLLLFSGLGLATEAVGYLEEIRDSVENIKSNRSNYSSSQVPISDNRSNFGSPQGPNSNYRETTGWVCKSCNTANPNSSTFCRECGEPKL